MRILIDIPEDTLRFVSMCAAKKDISRKKHIENIIDLYKIKYDLLYKADYDTITNSK